MAAEVYIFNPDNDMALAKGDANYIAPAFAARLTCDLEPLMAWCMPPGSLLVVHDVAVVEPWLAELRERYGVAVKAIGIGELPRSGNLHPWGWSPTLRRLLLKRGVSAACLPTEDELVRWRGLSHRRTSIVFHEQVRRAMSERFAPAPVELRTAEEVTSFAVAHPGCYVKLPWSASGRGVWHVHDAHGRDFAAWLRGGLSRYGSVLCEVGVDRVLDFAIAFECRACEARPVGLSLFSCDAHNQYSHAVVATDATLRRRIASRYPRFDLLEGALTRVVNEVMSPVYEGPLGVDLLLGNLDGECVVNPCVEVNLRMTMGMITSRLGNLLMSGDNVATFRVGEASAVPRGALQLTPLYAGTRHAAWLEH